MTCHASADQASAAIKHGAALGESVQSIKKIISDAKRQIKSKKAQMVKHLDRFATSISTELERWYEGGDIFGKSMHVWCRCMCCH